jgi:methylmalonyl-CoA mutase
MFICSTDKTYPDLVPAFTAAIKKATPDTIVAIAGYPKENVEAFKQAGVSEFIHLKANNLRILKTFQEITGV